MKHVFIAYMNTISSRPSMTLLDIIREEGQRAANCDAAQCGFKYLMAHLGTFDDFKTRRILFIRRKQQDGSLVNYAQLRAKGKTDKEIHKLFVRFFTREYVLGSAARADPPSELVQSAWLSFKANKTSTNIIGPARPGGKVTYAQLVAEGKSDDDIEKIFHASRRTYEAMEEGSYRSKMYEELQKMITKFNPDDYYLGKPAPMLSDDVEKHSDPERHPRPVTRTTFCQAVARMMTLVRFAHKDRGAAQRNIKEITMRENKKIANNKRTEKYNRIKNQMGVENFNHMKARDQAAKEKKAAEKVSQAGMMGRTATFVKWRTETEAGKKYDTAPAKAYVTSLPSVNSVAAPPIKHLGYTSHANLAQVVRRCLNDTSKYSDIYIKFTPDPGDASSQLYQYAPLYGERPVQLRKTRDVDTVRTFRVCGMLKRWTSPPEYYIQPDQQNGRPMRGNVYFALPTEWKDYEQWTGFGIRGNPQKATNMETLFKIVDNNITEVTFFTNGGRYRTAYSNYSSKSVDQIFGGIVKIPTPAEAATAAAKLEKEQRAKKARKKEAEKRERELNKKKKLQWIEETLGGEKYRSTFNTFFGVDTKQEDSTSQAKVNLALQLASGKISQDTFNTAMNALQ